MSPGCSSRSRALSRWALQQTRRLWRVCRPCRSPWRCRTPWPAAARSTATLAGNRLTFDGKFEGLAVAGDRRPSAPRAAGDAGTRRWRPHGVEGDDRHDQRVDRPDAAAATGAREELALHPGSQREGAGRQSVGMAAAAGDDAMTRVMTRAVRLVWVRVSPSSARRGGHWRPAAAGAAGSFAGAGGGGTADLRQRAAPSCHRPDLSGGAEAPALAGANFTEHVGYRARRASWPTTSRRRCRRRPAPMPAQQALALTAFILQSNGARAGAIPLAAGEATSIAAAVRGQAPAGAPAPGRRPPRGSCGSRHALPPGRGLTVAGEVPNYVPVTDAMLRNPPAGDWLMIRRNYQAWSHSPLTEITPGQRRAAADRVGVGDERGRRKRADADRPQRHHLSHQHRQHRAGARRTHRRT